MHACGQIRLALGFLKASTKSVSVRIWQVMGDCHYFSFRLMQISHLVKNHFSWHLAAFNEHEHSQFNASCGEFPQQPASMQAFFASHFHTRHCLSHSFKSSSNLCCKHKCIYNSDDFWKSLKSVLFNHH